MSKLPSIPVRITVWLSTFWMGGLFLNAVWPTRNMDPFGDLLWKAFGAPIYLPAGFGAMVGTLFFDMLSFVHLVPSSGALRVGAGLLVFVCLLGPYPLAIYHLVSSLRTKNVKVWWILEALLVVAVILGVLGIRFVPMMPTPG
jgi:hypothetical protein